MSSTQKLVVGLLCFWLVLGLVLEWTGDALLYGDIESSYDTVEGDQMYKYANSTIADTVIQGHSFFSRSLTIWSLMTGNTVGEVHPFIQYILLGMAAFTSLAFVMMLRGV